MSKKDKSDNNEFGVDANYEQALSDADQINEVNDAIKSTPEYKVGKNINKWVNKYAEKNHSLDGNPDRLPNEDPEEMDIIKKTDEVSRKIREANSEGGDFKIEDHGEPTTADEHNKEWLDDGIHMHNKDRAKKFLNSLRGHLIVSQALTYGIKHLRALEDRENKYPKDGEHAEPSNRSDMEYLKEHLFPLYDVFKAA